MTSRYCSQLPDALRIVAVWESAEAAERFFDSLPADNKARLAPDGAPARSSFPAHRVYRRPIAADKPVTDTDTDTANAPASDRPGQPRLPTQHAIWNELVGDAWVRHPERLDDTITAITNALRPLEGEGVVHFQASALIVTAHASGRPVVATRSTSRR